MSEFLHWFVWLHSLVLIGIVVALFVLFRRVATLRYTLPNGEQNF